MEYTLAGSGCGQIVVFFACPVFITIKSIVQIISCYVFETVCSFPAC